MNTFIDTAGAVRAGEDLDLDRLLPWLAQTLPGLSGVPQVTQFSGGASNWTYRLKFEHEDLILRRPPAGTRAKSAHDMRREYELQQALRPHFFYVPRMRAYTDDESVIGAEFYVMDRLEGIIPRKNLPRGLDLSPERARALCTNVLDVLVALHKVDHRSAGLDKFGAGAGYVRRQVEGWNKRYGQARTWNVPRATAIMHWLAANIPADEHLCLTHNDFRFDNVVLDVGDPTRVIGVLDWELATIGDPFVDLGNLLAYWVEAGDDRFAKSMRRQPTTIKGMLNRAEVIDYYCKAIGMRPANMAFYEVFGLFRLSVIVQQIYYRYHHRQTRNPAFRNFWIAVHYLHHRCRKRMAEVA
jgi:aminoglycoside phosphotransferase (APT) family kinase protein